MPIDSCAFLLDFMTLISYGNFGKVPLWHTPIGEKLHCQLHPQKLYLTLKNKAFTNDWYFCCGN